MNADSIRHFYEYHFNENRTLWERYVMPLTQEQFTQPVEYSLGSVCNQLVHIMNVDETWFCELRGVELKDWRDPAAFDDRDVIRAEWDKIEQIQREYLAALSDEKLNEKPVPEGEDKDLIAWQILLHVVNHGTDHRAQVLRVLHDLGVNTTSQDYIFYVYDHPLKSV